MRHRRGAGPAPGSGRRCAARRACRSPGRGRPRAGGPAAVRPGSRDRRAAPCPDSRARAGRQPRRRRARRGRRARAAGGPAPAAGDVATAAQALARAGTRHGRRPARIQVVRRGHDDGERAALRRRPARGRRRQVGGAQRRARQHRRRLAGARARAGVGGRSWPRSAGPRPAAHGLLPSARGPRSGSRRTSPRRNWRATTGARRSSGCSRRGRPRARARGRRASACRGRSAGPPVGSAGHSMQVSAASKPAARPRRPAENGKNARRPSAARARS